MLYCPPSFCVDDQEKLFDFIKSHSFATLVSSTDTVPAVTHAPLLLDASQGPRGALVGHMARANPHWEQLQGKDVLAIFAGPHAYVSPRWCSGQNVVPTWNYVVAHVVGRVELLESREHRMRVVEQYVRFYEQSATSPWSIERPESQWLDELLDGIVAFQIPIDDLTGKWKLSQNHSAERREEVASALAQQEDANAQSIAAWMRAQE